MKLNFYFPDPGKRIALRVIAFIVLNVAGLNGLHAQYSSYAIIDTYAGKGTPPMEQFIEGHIARDAAGNLYIAEANLHRVIKISGGTVTVIAGTGTGGYNGDGIAATSAQLNFPFGVAVDAAGDVYISEVVGLRIRKVNVGTGIITTIAGTGERGAGGDGGPATAAQFADIRGIAFDGSGNLFVTDFFNNSVRKIDAVSGIITKVAGSGVYGFSGDGGPATAAALRSPIDVAIDVANNIYISDANNNRIRRVDAATGIISTVAGTGATGYNGDGIPATSASINVRWSLTVDGSGNIYITDYANFRIRKITAATGFINTIAGTGVRGFMGDGGPALNARIPHSIGIESDPAGNIYFTQAAHQRVRKIDQSTGTISSVYQLPGTIGGDIGDGGHALNAQLNIVRDIAIDAAGNVYVAEGGEGVDQFFVAGNNRVRKIDAVTKIITTIAGTGERGFYGDGGPATDAQFMDVAGLALDASGNLFIADRYNNRIRRVDAVTGIITTIAGAGAAGFPGSGRPAISSLMDKPQDLVIDAAGNLYISSAANHAIFKVAAGTGILTIVAGNNTAGFSGDGGPAINALLNDVHGMVVDAAGNLIFCDKGNHRIRKIDIVTGIITTIAGTGNPGSAGDGGPAIAAELIQPDDVGLAPNGNLVIAEVGNHRMRLLDMSSGKLYTVAGTGVQGFSGDGGQATAAQLSIPDGMAISSTGVTYIADQGNHRVRTFTVPAITGLPVTWLSFDVKKAGNNAILSWSTTVEVGTSHFEIERSEDGIAFAKAGIVLAGGTTSNISRYQYTDHITETNNRIVYYRLRSVDFDSKATLSKTVPLQLEGSLALNNFAVYPNPFTSGIKLGINSAKETMVSIGINSITGRQLINKTVRLQPGENIVVLNDLGNLPAGAHLMVITAGQEKIVQKIIKSK